MKEWWSARRREIWLSQLGTLKEAKTHSVRHNLIITALLVLSWATQFRLDSMNLKWSIHSQMFNNSSFTVNVTDTDHSGGGRDLTFPPKMVTHCVIADIHTFNYTKSYTHTLSTVFTDTHLLNLSFSLTHIHTQKPCHVSISLHRLWRLISPWAYLSFFLVSLFLSLWCPYIVRYQTFFLIRIRLNLTKNIQSMSQ